MSTNNGRTLNPSYLRILMSHVQSSAMSQHDQLVGNLAGTSKITKGEAENIVKSACSDGLLISEKKKVRRHSYHTGSLEKLQNNTFYRLPKSDEINALTIDPYCFECNLPINVRKCRDCKRSFHLECYRSNPEKPMYQPPLEKNLKNRPPTFWFDNEEYEAGTSFRSGSAQTTQDVLNETIDAGQQNEQNGNFENDINEGSQNNHDENNELKPEVMEMKHRIENEDDVVCVGQVRAASRRSRVSAVPSYKSELQSNQDDFEEEHVLCTCCRLLALANLRNPPNRKADELCHLLNFTFQRNRSWLAFDVPGFLDSLEYTKTEIQNISKLLFAIEVKTLDSMAVKLSDVKYSSLMEFLVDVLDIQHTVGVFFGDNSHEYEQTKWLVRDLQHDICEICHCPDCYRYSNEKFTDIWFALPCHQRHELVYAKQSGFSYWPAKVIRVLPNNKYDVRFFGSDHSRAFIPPNCIKPIDANPKTLKMGKGKAIKKALEELQYHQYLTANYSGSLFSFKADPNLMKSIIQGVKSNNKSTSEKVVRMTGIYAAITSVAEEQVPPPSITNQPVSSEILVAAGDEAFRVSFPQPVDDVSIPTMFPNDGTGPSPAKRARGSSSKENSSEGCLTRGNKNNSMLQNALDELRSCEMNLTESNKKRVELEKSLSMKNKVINDLKEKLKAAQEETKNVKKKVWCSWCLKEAKFLCCIKGVYCSTNCQTRHWQSSHEKDCVNENKTKKN